MTPAPHCILHGVIPIVPTPFRSDETVDFEALKRCVQFAIACRFPAVCMPAYASEFYKLSEQERFQVVECAIAAAEGRVGIVAQANHTSARHAAELAARYEALGASAIAFALPRQFGLSDEDLLEFSRRVCVGTRLPIVIQDFFPGGSCIAGDFAARLHAACPNFRYVKLEEPLVGAKVRDIICATGGEIGVLEGWGGMYMMELLSDGIVGVMPGLGPADLIQQIWDLMYRGERDEAMEVFQYVLPQLVFSLQNFEFWLYVEKQLLAARGVIPQSSALVRLATRRLDPSAVRHALWLNERLLRVLDRLGLPRQPIA